MYREDFLLRLYVYQYGGCGSLNYRVIRLVLHFWTSNINSLTQLILKHTLHQCVFDKNMVLIVSHLSVNFMNSFYI
jgi:hypothetical protein